MKSTRLIISLIRGQMSYCWYLMRSRPFQNNTKCDILPTRHSNALLCGYRLNLFLIFTFFTQDLIREARSGGRGGERIFCSRSSDWNAPGFGGLFNDTNPFEKWVMFSLHLERCILTSQTEVISPGESTAALRGESSWAFWDLHTLWHSSFHLLMWKVLRKREWWSFLTLRLWTHRPHPASFSGSADKVTLSFSADHVQKNSILFSAKEHKYK